MFKQRGSDREYNKLKRSLCQLAIEVSTFGLQSLEMVIKYKGQKKEKFKKKKIHVARKSKDWKNGPKLEKLSGIRKVKLENGECRHIIPRSMPKEERKEYFRVNELHIFCFTPGHMTNGCDFVKEKNVEKADTGGVNVVEELGNCQGDEKVVKKTAAINEIVREEWFVGVVDDIEPLNGEQNCKQKTRLTGRWGHSSGLILIWR
eukprot:augustus_masked-scaffold_97-processed-gene-0.0-mRNA-1 protein AED:1.00 eAED:1.00 QI:0/-1/0/0/-1/1/1/0/203